MVFAFYAPMHGQCATTTNLLSITSVLALQHDIRILILQSHFELNNLEDSVVRKPKIYDEFDLWDDYGVDSLLRNMNLEPINRKMIENSCYSFVDERIHLLPGTKAINKDSFEHVAGKGIIDIIEEARKHYDYIFVDVNSGRNNSLTTRILSQSDKIAVNLSQNPQVIDIFFDSTNKKVNSFDLNKAIYLFGNYDRRSRYNLTNLSRKFEHISKNKSAAIEYCVNYRDAIWDASVLKFFRKNINCSKKDKNFSYIESVKKASELIMREAGVKHVK